MHNQFPIIHNISDVIDFIKDHDEFIMFEKDDYVVFDYAYCTPDTFPIEKPILRECRGLIFSKSGTLLRRPYHKFFNLNEKEETRIIPDLKNTIALEKLDGSLVAPFVSRNKIRWGTKAGITEFTTTIENFISSFYVEFVAGLIKLGYTPIFEWCSRKNKIVIDYHEDCLILTAIRNMTTGEYMPYSLICKLANVFNIPVVKYLHIKDIEEIKNQKDTEGIVLRYPNGNMIKIKTEWYVNLHKIKDYLRSEKTVINLLFQNKLDDPISFLDKFDQKVIELFCFEFLQSFNNFIGEMDELFKLFEKLDKKTYALEYSKVKPSWFNAFIFSKLSNPTMNSRDYFKNYILKRTASNQSFREVENLFSFKGIKEYV